MNINGKTMIFKNDYGYSTSISKKNKEDKYDKIYVAVQFLSGVEVENKTLIEIKNGFISFYSTKDGLPKIKLIILDFEIISNNDDNLPF